MIQNNEQKISNKTSPLHYSNQQTDEKGLERVCLHIIAGISGINNSKPSW